MHDPKILVIGHSHVNCIDFAARRMGRPPWLRVINIRQFAKDGRILDTVRARTEGFEPDVLCLCLRGNFHNVIGMLEHPQPFSVGSVPGAIDGRHMIPHALMRALFRQEALPELTSHLFRAFPGAERLMLNAPPPVADFAHIRENPGVFAESIAQGPAPDELRLHLYELQTGVFRDLAAEHGARFVELPDRIFDPSGFLATDYAANDPTHANAAYGQEMLAVLRAAVRVAA